MKLKTLFLIGILAALVTGCVVVPPHGQYKHHRDYSYDRHQHHGNHHGHRGWRR